MFVEVKYCDCMVDGGLIVRSQNLEGAISIKSPMTFNGSSNTCSPL